MGLSYHFRNAFLTQAEVGRNETRQVRSGRALSHSGNELCGAPGHTCTELPALLRKASRPVERSPDPVTERKALLRARDWSAGPGHTVL